MKKYSKNVILDTVYCINLMIESKNNSTPPSRYYRFLVPVLQRNYNVDLVWNIWKELAGDDRGKLPTGEQLKVLVRILQEMADKTL